jgi:hypothetical protein
MGRLEELAHGNGRGLVAGGCERGHTGRTADAHSHTRLVAMAGKAVANGFVHAWTSCRACPITGLMPRPRGSWCSEQTALAHGLRTLAAATRWRTQRMHGGISGGMGPRRRCHGLAPSDLSAASRWKQATQRAQVATMTCWQAAAQKRPRHARKWRLGHQGGVGWPEATRLEVLGAARGRNRRRRPVTTGAGDGEFFPRVR